MAQTRAACANEVRKRDRQMDGLKKAVAEAGRARGERKSPGITTITVTGEVGGGGDGDSIPSGTTADDGYDLRTETNAFLAELARGLSEENESLLDLVRRTNRGLKVMSGFSGDGETRGDGHVVSLTASCEDMSAEMDAVLEHLRTILTNPSFVPIEEVVLREDEIHRLRDGWVKMEGRWKEAVHLLDGWRRRMVVSGRSVNMEELKMGLRLSPVRVRDVEETSQGIGLRLGPLEEEEEEHEEHRPLQTPSPETSLHLVPAPEYIDADDSDSESSIFEDVVDLHELEMDEPNVQILEQSVMFQSVDEPPLPPPPQITPLGESEAAGNRGEQGNARGRKRPGDCTTIVEEKTQDLTTRPAKVSAPKPRAAAAPVPKAPAAKHSEAPQKVAKTVARPTPQDSARPTSAASQVSTASTDSVLLVKTSSKPSPTAQAATKPPKPASLKPRQPAAREPSPARQPAARAPSRTSAKNTAAAGSTGGQKDEPERPPPAAKTSSSEMPPPPVPARAARPDDARPRSPAKPAGSSRLPLPRGVPAPPQSPLSTAAIAAKLAASEREADAARVRAKLKAARLGKKAGPLAAPTVRAVVDPGAGPDDVDPVKRPLPPPTADEDDELAASGGSTAAGAVALAPRKRELRASRAASRRRSTLNPWELETLISGAVGVAPSPGRVAV